MDKDVIKQIIGLSARIRKEAEDLDKLPGAALVAAASGSMVIGFVGGGLLWIPAAMTGGMFVYKSIVTVLHYKKAQRQDRVQETNVILKQLEDIERAPISMEYKKRLSEFALEGLEPRRNENSKLVLIEEEKGESLEYKEK
ncbi:hypothetical protein [Azohydromonas aeria]|uniref:hypothetical protein n=1 Tax=Azohydromonas aeria TaxID=2590212 RepID=UPI0012FA42CF|nr:hypothetical protein [Azohydromonas aeria]